MVTAVIIFFIFSASFCYRLNARRAMHDPQLPFHLLDYDYSAHQSTYSFASLADDHNVYDEVIKPYKIFCLVLYVMINFRINKAAYNTL